MRRHARRIWVCVLAAVMMVGGIQLNGITASAAEYKGKGMKTDPYIVETAEQLDGIRNNLKAHYKLGNTIDLSGVSNFKPIGTLDKPFTGTFSCDLDDAGKPKYAIKNLKIEIKPAGATKAEGWTGYKENKSGWEAGLFGCASKATFKNILVLDATVSSTVQGCYQVNSDYSVNPGQDEQATGILVAIGKGVTASGCGVSGTVTSSSNHVGGMFGSMGENSKISKCYSYATVTSTGTWGSGGLVGSATRTTIKTSFYSGVFSGGQTHAGAFAGSVYDGDVKYQGTIVDCWAEGTVKTETSGCFLGTKVHKDESPLTNIMKAKNCYTLAKIEGRKNAQTNRNVTNNNYITNEPGGLEIGFAAASQAEINAAFQSLPNWVVADGTYPQIKGLVPTKDASAYVVQTVTDTPETGEGQTTTEGDAAGEEGGVTDSTVQEGEKAEVQVETVFENTTSTLSKQEFVLVVVLSALVILSLIAAVVVVIVVMCQNRRTSEKVKASKKVKKIKRFEDL